MKCIFTITRTHAFLQPLAHAFLAPILLPLLPLEPAFQLQCSRKVGMKRPSRHCGFIVDPGCGDASPGPVQLVVSLKVPLLT
jgi:hypothetical protein